MQSPGSRVPPLHALAVYAESLAAGRRVAVLGDAELGLGERFEQMGARQVVVAGPDDDLDALRGRAFDLVVVPDLGLFDDAAELLARVRRMVGDTGAAVVAAANRDAAQAEGLGAFDYYELFDLVAAEFEDVRMIAQLPFRGVALAELGEQEESPAVSVDTQLADGERAPEVFVALASQRGVRLDPYVIVELPEVEALEHVEAPEQVEAPEHVEAPAAAEPPPAPPPAAAHARELEAALSDLVQERLRAEALQVQNDELRASALRVAELERALADRAHQIAALLAQVAEARSAVEAGRTAAARVEELAPRAERAERRLAAFEAEVSRAAELHAVELQRYEEALRDRAQAIRLLEAEILRRERMVRELVDALEEHAAQPPPVEQGPSEQDALIEENARLRARLDALALELARREGEGQATAWAVQELERRLDEAAARPAATRPSPDLEGKLATALDELDALRRALTQEHDARVRAESGEELARARAEIQRQAALLQQLGRDGEGPGGAGREELR